MNISLEESHGFWLICSSKHIHNSWTLQVFVHFQWCSQYFKFPYFHVHVHYKVHTYTLTCTTTVFSNQNCEPIKNQCILYKHDTFYMPTCVCSSLRHNTVWGCCFNWHTCSSCHSGFVDNPTFIQFPYVYTSAGKAWFTLVHTHRHIRVPDSPEDKFARNGSQWNYHLCSQL